jgi:hypothetical protein
MAMILLEPAYKIFHTSVKFKRRTISVTPFSRNYGTSLVREADFPEEWSTT